MIAIREPTWGPADDGDRFDRAVEWLLIGLLAFMPLAFGVVHAWSEEVVLALAAALLLCFCLKRVLAPETTVTWTWVYLPIGGFLLVAVLQMIPLPTGLVRLISPQTAAKKLELLKDLAGPQGLLSSATISFYVHATKHDLRLVLAAAAVFFVVLNTMRRPDQIARLLGAVAIIGGAVAIEALLQAAFGNGRLYWSIPSPHGVALSGPFVNHSHFAQFMNLSIGAALGLIVMRVHERFDGRPVTPSIAAEYLGSREGKILLGLMLLVVLGTASIFVSLSRGGMISTMIAGAFTVLVISLGRPVKGSGWILALLALGAFICVLYVGFDAVYDRLGTLHDIDRAEGGRWQILKDIAVAWTRFPLFGTGLGTHEVVYPMFDRSTVAAIASHAENEYAQAAEETGLTGLVALIAFGTLVWIGYARAVRVSRDPLCSAAFGLGFGLVAILLHSLGDFGQHLPANAFLSVIFCAVLIRLSGAGVPARGVPHPVSRKAAGGRRGPILCLAAVALVAAIALADADAARRAETHWARALEAEHRIAANDWQGSDGEYTYLLGHAAKAQDDQPANITYRHWLNVYRWRAITRVNDPNAEEIVPAAQMLEFADRIADELRQALRKCPTHGPTWTILGQIERYTVADRETGVRHILRGRQLAPNDPITCLVSGGLRAEQGQVEVAFADLRRAVELDEKLFTEVATLLVKTLGRPEAALDLVSDNVLQLMSVEKILKESDGCCELRTTLANRILCLLEQECRSPGATGDGLARLAERYADLGRNDEAVDTYQAALKRNYNGVMWRYRLARLLADEGRKSEALGEVEICLQLQPGFVAAKTLREVLLLRTSAESSSN